MPALRAVDCRPQITPSWFYRVIPLQGEAQERGDLERYWRERWQKAKLDLETARAGVQSLKDEADLSGPDHGYAHERYTSAMMIETSALIEYSRILRLYTDVMVHGKLPERE